MALPLLASLVALLTPACASSVSVPVGEQPAQYFHVDGVLVLDVQGRVVCEQPCGAATRAVVRVSERGLARPDASLVEEWNVGAHAQFAHQTAEYDWSALMPKAVGLPEPEIEVSVVVEGCDRWQKRVAMNQLRQESGRLQLMLGDVHLKCDERVQKGRSLAR